MLRITISDTPTQQTLTLHGRLTGPWVEQLQSCWTNAQAARGDRACVVDLTNLISVDQKGEEILRAMMNEGAQFRACGVNTTHMLKGLALQCRRGRP